MSVTSKADQGPIFPGGCLRADSRRRFRKAAKFFQLIEVGRRSRTSGAGGPWMFCELAWPRPLSGSLQVALPSARAFLSFSAGGQGPLPAAGNQRS